MSVRVGFVGVGGIAKRHLGSCRERDDVEMVGFCDVNEEVGRAVAEEYGGPFYQNFIDLYEREKPHMVIICTPPFAHGDIEVEAARRGIHFFVEKPVAINMQMAREIAAVVEESGIATQVGYMFRFADPVRQVRSLLEDRAIAMVQAHYYMPGMPNKGWWSKMDMGGGQLVEQATHMLDLGRFLAGEVKTVIGRTARVRDWMPPPDYEPGAGLVAYYDGFDIPDTTALILEYEGGALGTLSCSLVPQKKWDNGFRVVADGLLAQIDGPNAQWAGDEEGSAQVDPSWVHGVLYELIDAVKAGSTETSVPYCEGVKSLAISLAGYESVNRGCCPVALSEFLEG